ncbi:prepilin-type N-terminal cleavage/methylation domain-containing protein [Erysipelothrix urinaevulpis]|uniref:prepilin-type N-terminal cleavage/methylation domain-containing protein n=1 Tax=Erysipelothrix urinaevulpis TaxID=2683717 RepID=UPI0019169620|nr:prepilin-type N-terminal cleavage/methylation domain-containing protein [Erysipelothrix urinaevulpis]
MKLIKNNNKDEGFTLIELVVVIAILAILALILIPSLMGYNKKAEKSKNDANARNVYTAATLVVSEKESISETDLKAELEKGNLVGIDDWKNVTITIGADKKIEVKVGDPKNKDTLGQYPVAKEAKE